MCTHPQTHSKEDSSTHDLLICTERPHLLQASCGCCRTLWRVLHQGWTQPVYKAWCEQHTCKQQQGQRKVGLVPHTKVSHQHAPHIVPPARCWAAYASVNKVWLTQHLKNWPHLHSACYQYLHASHLGPQHCCSGTCHLPITDGTHAPRSQVLNGSSMSTPMLTASCRHSRFWAPAVRTKFEL
jgi:hypothetical protein